MAFRYNLLQRILKKVYRKFDPVPKSPWTQGPVSDICEINLVPPEKLKIFFAKCIKTLQKSKGKDIGAYLEFGVFNGSSMASMYQTAKNMGQDSMQFFGFDAFRGLHKNAEKEDGGVWKRGHYSCSFANLKKCLKKKSVNPSKINWIRGWYNTTLNKQTIKKYKIKNPGIVFIDCDTYSASKKVLDFVTPLITRPVIICLDDWKLNDLDIKGMGEYRAFNEFLEKNTHLQAQEMRSYNRKSKAFLVMPKNKG